MLAIIHCVQDLVEAFASIQLMNGSVDAASRNELMRPVSIFSARGRPSDKPVAIIRFQTASKSFPCPQVKDGDSLSVPGTNFKFIFLNGCPSYSPIGAVKRFSCPRSEKATLDEIQASAVRSAGFVIGENMEGASIIFKDAVMSRFQYFARSRLEIEALEDTACAEVAQPLRTNPAQHENLQLPFVKPKFSSLEDLLPAFACDERLVFCHEISTPTMIATRALDELENHEYDVL